MLKRRSWPSVHCVLGSTPGDLCGYLPGMSSQVTAPIMTLPIALACLFLAGCAQTVWVKDGAGQQDFAKDSYGCERDMRQSGYYGTGLAGVANAQGFQDRRMVANGWHKEIQEAAPSAPTQSKDDYDRRSAAFAACFNAGLRADTPEFNGCFQSRMQ
jgi:hypothetical protein